MEAYLARQLHLLEQPDPVRLSSSKLKDLPCRLCRQPGKYRCPGCLEVSCSIVCSQQHKQATSCSGERSASKFVKKAEYSELEGERDFRFLVQGTEEVDVAHKRLRVMENYCDNTRFKLLKQNCWKHSRIRFLMAPSIISRHRENISFYFTKSRSIFWVFELLVFTGAKYERFLTDPLEDSNPVQQLFRQGFFSEPLLKVGLDSEKWFDLVGNQLRLFVKNEHEAKGVEDSIKEGGTPPLYLADKDWANCRFLEVGRDQSLSAILQGSTVREFPTLHAIPLRLLAQWTAKKRCSFLLR